jgi:hypothetical protein
VVVEICIKYPEGPPGMEVNVADMNVMLLPYIYIYIYIHISPRDSSWTPGVFCTYFYNHTRRLRLEKLKLVYLELSRIPDGFLKVLLDPGGGFTSETAARRSQK